LIATASLGCYVIRKVVQRYKVFLKPPSIWRDFSWTCWLSWRKAIQLQNATTETTAKFRGFIGIIYIIQHSEVDYF